MRFVYLFLFLCVCILPRTFSQTDTLILDAYRSNRVIIYAISKQDALDFYTITDSKKEAEKLHALARNPIDTVSASTFADYDFPFGYYISERIVNTLLQYELHISVPFDIKVINNQRDFIVLVHDIHGSPILDAEVKINKRTIHLDKKTNTYRIPTANCKGQLQVSVKGFTKLYTIDREQNNPDYKRFSQKFFGFVLKPIRILLYRTPIKYIARPVRRIITFPVRVIKHPQTITNIYMNPYRKAKRVYNKTKLFAIKSYYYFYIDKADNESVNQEYDYYNYRDLYTKHKSVLYLNQPKYKLKDSLFCKAYVTNKKGKPINSDLKLLLVVNENYKTKILSKHIISPTHPGSYEFRKKLQDTVPLKIDKEYTLILKPVRGREIIAKKSFYIEEYKLKNVRWNVTLASDDVYAPDSVRIHISGTDANKQPIMGGSVRYSVTVDKIINHLSDIEFIPNTVLADTIQVQTNGKAEIVIPASKLTRANAKYAISLAMVDVNNELQTEKKYVTYYNKRSHIEYSKQNNALHVVYMENTDTIETQAVVTYVDANNVRIQRDTIVLPGSIVPLPFAANINVRVGSMSRTINCSLLPSGVEFQGAFVDKNVVLQIDNARNLPVYYEMYVNKRKIHRDTCTQLEYSKRANIRKNYLVSIQYIWAGKVVSDFYSVRKKKSELDIVQINKKNVSPGDSVEITLLVKNYKNKPVKHVDVASWAISSKFTDYEIPRGIQFPEKVVNPQQINSFNLQQKPKVAQSKAMLQTDVFKQKLTGISFYDFRYPYQKIYRYEIPTPDSSTQFAPYVFVDGVLQPIYFLYVDDTPVYYNFCGNNTNYSFDVPKTKTNKVTIEIRTHNKTIILKNVQFSKGNKTILSIDGSYCRECKITEMPQYLTYAEEGILQRTVGRISPRYNGFTVVQTDNLLYRTSDSKSFFIGPVNYGGITVQDFTNKVNVSLPFMPRDDVRAHTNYAYIIKSDFWFPYFEYTKEKNKKHIVLKKDAYLQPITPYAFKLTRQDVLHEWRNRYEQSLYTTYNSNTNYYKNPYKLTLLTEQYNAYANNPKIFRIIVVNLCDSSIVIDKGYAKTFNLPKTGKYVVMLVFIDKTYWVSPQFLVQENGVTYMQIPDSLVVYKDFDLLTNTQLYDSYLLYSESLSIDLSKVTGTTKRYYQSEKLIPTDNSLITHDSRKAIKITGKITDEKGEPLIAASIAEEGTTNGTYSDIDGLWELWVHDTQAVLECSYVGFSTETIKVGKETDLSVVLKQDAVQLQAVVRVGYAPARYEDVTGSIVQIRGEEIAAKPLLSVDNALQGKAAGVQIRSNSGTPGAGMDLVVRGMGTAGEARPLYVVDGVPVGTDWKGDPNTIESISILKDATSVAMYGSRGASGVVLITTKGGNSVSASSFSWKDAAKHPDVYASNQIRETFRDYAYWQPTLRTDKHGMVKFTAKMPDDINTWNTFVVAHSEKRQSGDYQSQIITDKPLIAELSVPDFLIEGDTSIIRGNAKNYGGSAVSVTNTFIHNGKQLSISDTVVQTIITNEQAIVAPHIDTCKVQFTTATNFGYTDTEIRKIPVFPQGTKETVGMFAYTLRDTVLWIKPDTVVGNIKLHVAASTLDIYEKELMRLQQYPHACNEQKASKLMAYLLWEKICKNSNQPFTGRAQVMSLIKQLDDNNYEHSGWAWWGKAEPVLWVTLHVIKSLQFAKDMGYEVKSSLHTPLTLYKLDLKKYSVWQSLEMLEILYSVSEHIDKEYLHTLDTLKHIDDYSKLRIIRLKQLYGMPYSVDSVIAKAHVSFTGGAYWGDERYRYSTGNIIPQTLCAYKILQDDTTHTFDLQSVFFYFAMERNKTGYWMNTLESAQILSTLVPLAIIHAQPIKPAKLVIPHISAETITAFPYSTEFPAIDSFKLELSCNRPVYITSTTSYWNPKPNVKSDYFDVTSAFKRNKEQVQTLIQGEQVELHVTIRAKKDAQYVMVEIPIPAGCTYESKQKQYSEVHREHFNNKVYVYVQRMPKGTHTYTVKLSSTHAGTYTLNPARVELMYYPIFNGHNACKKVVVK